MLYRNTLKKALIAGFLFTSAPAFAETLTVALKTEPSALDPQYHALTPNFQVSFSIFECLVSQTADLATQPSLATSWKNISEREWEFSLRPGVTFSDGSPFTAEDFVFSVERISKIPNSPSPLTLYTRQIEKIDIIDPLKIRITTKTPYALLLSDLAYIPVMSKKAASGSAAEGKTTTELNSGDGLIGTGPFKFVSWSRGSEIVFARNDTYWGKKPVWDKIIYKPITNSAARMAALLSGGADIAEDPPTDDVTTLKKDKNLRIVEKPSARLIYIAMDQFADQSPGISGTDGKNPLKDKRVRKALSLALDRKAIAERVMGGVATPAANLIPYPMFGTTKERAQAEVTNAEEAKKLLTAAGYPNGFSIVLGSPNGRYINDAKVAQTVASLWTRIGVKTSVDSVTPPVFFKNRDTYQYSAYLAGWSVPSGEMSNPLVALLATPDKEKGLGTTNRGRYSNPAMDELLLKALSTTNDDSRRKLLEQASALVLDDYGLLPIHFEQSVWAMKKGLTYEGRADQMTLAQYVRKAD